MARGKRPKGLGLNRGYWRWRNPLNGKYIYLQSHDEAGARREAKALNEEAERELERREREKSLEALSKPYVSATRKAKSVRSVFQYYQKNHIEKIDTGATAKDKINITDRIIKDFGDADFTKLDTPFWNDYLSQNCSYHRYQKYKVIITQCYSLAKNVGLIDKNAENCGKEIEIIQYKKEPEKVRDPMTEEQFIVLYKHSPDWLKRILKFALLTSLRQGDILSLKFEQIKDGYIYVVPSKTKGLKRPRQLKFKLTEQLEDCGADKRLEGKVIIDSEVCPFIFYQDAYEKRLPSKVKEHPAQILKRYFVEQLLKVMESISAPCWSQYRSQFRAKKEEDRHYPTFHEIRGLSGRLLQECLGLEDIQLTRRYGHYDPTINPTTSKYSSPNKIANKWHEINEYIDFDAFIAGNLEKPFAYEE
jgi:integrase